MVYLILAGSLCGLSDGIFLSWSSPFIVQITQDKENYDISTEEASYFTTIPWIGFIIGCPVFAFLADKIGRKRTYFFTALLHLLAYLFAAFASDIYLFYTSRICFGLASSCYYAVFPIYIGEIANPEVRGRWGNAVASSIYLGGLLVNILGSYLNVSWTSYVCIPLPLLFLLLFNAMPESPYYLVMKGYEDEAKQALRFFTRKTDVDNDYFILKMDVERQLSESGTFRDLFTIDSNRRALIAGVFLRVSQISSGLMIVFMFTQSIFQISGSEIDHGLLSIILMAANFGLNLLVLVFIVHRFSRKKLFVISSSHAGIVMFLLENLRTGDVSFTARMPATKTTGAAK
ncbi:unnamed protein product [Phyllotreta striolata]|uniref:Major facilitator superfamily (MFS) profile domain-containing protein n=1 Tax=Phyllotreta striolata TaxID=444603 RepID=A0A9N9XPU0_PHYSR|nr:unnamed protein product [Phyllotreta striolata]